MKRAMAEIRERADMIYPLIRNNGRGSRVFARGSTPRRSWQTYTPHRVHPSGARGEHGEAAERVFSGIGNVSHECSIGKPMACDSAFNFGPFRRAILTPPGA